MRKLIKDRYLKLADLLERNARRRTGARFDLGTLCSYMAKWQTNNPGPKMNCDTVGCAIGLAAVAQIIPGFKYERGLQYKGAHIGFRDVARQIFGADEKITEALFVPTPWWSGLKTTEAGGERNVAKAIRYLIAHDGVLPKGGRWLGVLRNPVLADA